MNGEALGALVGSFDAQGHFGDGMNLYLFAASNPITGSDPLGLYYDPYDEAIADLTGNKLYALGAINEGARWASLGLETTVKIAANLLPGYGLYEAFNSVQVIASGKGGFWDAMNIAMAAFPLAKGASNLVALKGMLRAGKFGRRACNCFVAGTPVDTPDGARPIELIQEGDLVMTRSEADPGGAVVTGQVTRVFRTFTPAVLWVSLASGQIIGTTPGHEVWTHQDGWTLACQLEVGETFMDRSGQPVQIVDLRLDPTPTATYNLEVDGTFTYFVEGVWVHNNSCGAVVSFFARHRHHAVPMFLQGDVHGVTVGMQRVLHQKRFHPELQRRLRRANIWYGDYGNWDDYFAAHPEKLDQAVDTLLGVSRDFERNWGHLMDGSLTQAVWQQLMGQNRVLSP